MFSYEVNPGFYPVTPVCKTRTFLSPRGAQRMTISGFVPEMSLYVPAPLLALVQKTAQNFGPVEGAQFSPGSSHGRVYSWPITSNLWGLYFWHTAPIITTMRAHYSLTLH